VNPSSRFDVTIFSAPLLHIREAKQIEELRARSVHAIKFDKLNEAAKALVLARRVCIDSTHAQNVKSGRRKYRYWKADTEGMEGDFKAYIRFDANIDMVQANIFSG